MILTLYYLVVALGSKILVPNPAAAHHLMKQLGNGATAEPVYCFLNTVDGYNYGQKCFAQMRDGRLATAYYITPAQLGSLQESTNRPIALNQSH